MPVSKENFLSVAEIVFNKVAPFRSAWYKKDFD